MTKKKTRYCLYWVINMGNFIDITGQKFNRLTPVTYLGNRKWRCKCDCGNIVDVFTNNLTRGNTKSCGCLNKELTSKRSKTYGLSNEKVFHIAVGIIQRCTNPNNNCYPNYGGRGVQVFSEWKENPSKFAKWMLDNGWYDGCHVDKDIKSTPDKVGYYPETISFISSTENARHKRNVIEITYHGKTQPLKTWCDELGLPYKTIFSRYKYGGWRDAVTLFETPVKVGNNQTLRGDNY